MNSFSRVHDKDQIRFLNGLNNSRRRRLPLASSIGAVLEYTLQLLCKIQEWNEKEAPARPLSELFTKLPVKTHTPAPVLSSFQPQQRQNGSIYFVCMVIVDTKSFQSFC